MVSSHEGQGSNFIVVIPREHGGEQLEDMAVESCCYTVDDEDAGADNNYTAIPRAVSATSWLRSFGTALSKLW